MSNQFAKDAEKILDFFNNAEDIYKRDFEDKGPVYFCLKVFGVEQFNMEEVELAYDSLNSIISIISRNVTSDIQGKVISNARKYVDRYHNWLKAVYNRHISDSSYELLFNNTDDADVFVNAVGNVKYLNDDFFTMIPEFNDKKLSQVRDIELDNDDEKKDSATDMILMINGEMSYICNDVPWTDRNKIWIGDERTLNTIISGKYRKVRDKFIVGVIKNLYDNFKDRLLFKTIIVNPDVSFRKGSNIKVDLNLDDSDRFAVIRRGD